MKRKMPSSAHSVDWMNWPSAPNKAKRKHEDRTSRNHLDRLALLWQHGYFERVKYERNRILYVPTNKLERELHHRGWLRKTRRDYDNRNRRRTNRPESWKHTVRIKDFMQVLRRDVRALTDVVLTEDGDAMQGGRGDLYAARRFKEHEMESIADIAPHRDDEQRFIGIAQQNLKDLDSLLLNAPLSVGGREGNEFE